MKILRTEIFLLNELTPEAKAQAFACNRDCDTEDQDWDYSILSDAEVFLESVGFLEPCISYSGFGYQGNEASFTCAGINLELLFNFVAMRGAEAQEEVMTLYRLANLDNNGLTAMSIESQDNHYSHENTVYLYWEDIKEGKEMSDISTSFAQENYNLVMSIAQGFMIRIYQKLEAQYAYLQSNEYLEGALADCYFSGDGRTYYGPQED